MNESILSNIKTKCVRTRLTNELAHFSPNELILEYGEKETIIVTILDTVNVYTFCITDNYPFHIPKIKINNYEYIDFLKITSPIFQKLLRKICGLSCLCCESYVCNGKWSPAMRLTHIIDEIRQFCKHKRNIINKFYADKVIDKYLISDINLDQWFY